jgi:hypothetical protein
MIAVAVLMAWAEPALAQRPFSSTDPLYRSETAPRAFFDGYAVSMEVAYHPATAAQGGDGLASTAQNPLGLAFRLDYQLAPQFDLSGIVDASGGTLGRSTLLSWVVLKYSWHVDGDDHALRLAIDPALSARGGFHQVDLAFFSSTHLSAMSGMDFGLGMRRVQLGYERLASVADAAAVMGPSAFAAASLSFDDAPPLRFLTTQAVGTELHMMMRYQFEFDLAESHVFTELLGQGGSYDLITAQRASSNFAEMPQSPRSEEWRGGVVWVRAGAALSRPHYRVSPFVALPVLEWMPEDSETPRSRVRLGARFMLR